MDVAVLAPLNLDSIVLDLPHHVSQFVEMVFKHQMSNVMIITLVQVMDAHQHAKLKVDICALVMILQSVILFAEME